MWFEQDNRIEEDMSEAVEGGATLAWRLLATLEGGSLLLASSALLAYSVRKKIAGQHRPGRNIRRVLVTNTTNTLGRELKRRLEERGCVVDTMTHTRRQSNEMATADGSLSSNGTASLLSNGTASLPNNDASFATEINDVRAPKVDAIVVIGAEPKAAGLDGMARLVNEDVYNNLKLLESQSHRVRYGGCIAWACAGDAGAAAGAFSDAGAAFDTVLHASLQHVAKVCHCEPIWVGRCEGVEQTAQRVVSALLSSQDSARTSRFSVRNAAHRVGEYLCRWLKLVT
ncbi:uncharacterized protein LOC124632911 [Helicoverpa zea]|uniref:uncharacterized protein LOC124632911 n=1 Tax=Helicoverpa zea TaxID=7113 RepID=UPI001F59798A|nr:uncharacterized protein LOC124632911 [Helicoverpa zea]